MYNQTTITQLGICRVKVEHKNKWKMCNFIVDPGIGQALLGIPNGISNILSLSCNTVGTEKPYTDANCSPTTPITNDGGNGQCYTNTRPETGEPGRSCTNTNRSHTAIQTQAIIQI